MVAKPNKVCLYAITIPMYLAWNRFPIYKLQQVIRKRIFVIHCAPTPPKLPKLISIAYQQRLLNHCKTFRLKVGHSMQDIP